MRLSRFHIELLFVFAWLFARCGESLVSPPACDCTGEVSIDPLHSSFYRLFARIVFLWKFTTQPRLWEKFEGFAW